MFAALFAFALVTTYAAEEIQKWSVIISGKTTCERREYDGSSARSSYIHPCGLKDPNYDQCIANSIDSLKDKICTGMPELNVSPTEPIIIDKVVIYDTNNLKLSISDSKITGYCDFVINSVRIDPEKLHMDIDLTVNHLNVDSTYDFDISLLVSLANKGLLHISIDNLAIKIKLDTKVVTKDGKKERYASKANTNLDIKTFKYVFDDSEKDLVQLHEIFRNTLNENEQDIISKVKPAVEETISKLVISIFNDVTLSRYEQLFPEEA